MYVRILLWFDLDMNVMSGCKEGPTSESKFQILSRWGNPWCPQVRVSSFTQISFSFSFNLWLRKSFLSCLNQSSSLSFPSFIVGASEMWEEDEESGFDLCQCIPMEPTSRLRLFPFLLSPVLSCFTLLSSCSLSVPVSSETADKPIIKALAWLKLWELVTWGLCPRDSILTMFMIELMKQGSGDKFSLWNPIQDSKHLKGLERHTRDSNQAAWLRWKVTNEI